MDKKNKNNKNKVKFLILYIVILCVLLGVGFYGIFSALNRDTIYEGVKINSYDISNMTREEALRLLNESLEREISDKQMKLNYKEFTYDVSIKELGYHYCYEKALDEAYDIGREGNVFNRIKTIMDTRKYGKTVELESVYDVSLINDLALKISDDINLESKEAQLNFNGGKISVTEDVVGRSVDIELLKRLIEENITILKNIEIPVKEIQPVMTKEQLSRINSVIGEFSTSYSTSSSDRKENIRVSARALDGKIVLPGETFSFNGTTGPRTRDKGYKEANIIIGGEFIPGVGGGVCQMSTTLYNALVRADLTIVQRSPHSIPSTYVPYGQDAAVSYGHLDLKFRNDFDFPIYIHTRTNNDKVFVYIYGDVNTKNYTVKLDSEIVETINPKEEIIEDNSLNPGEKIVEQTGRTGYKVKTYKSIIKNGKVVERNLLNSDFYKPRNYIYKVGPQIETNVEEESIKPEEQDTINEEQELEE